MINTNYVAFREPFTVHMEHMEYFIYLHSVRLNTGFFWETPLMFCIYSKIYTFYDLSLLLFFVIFFLFVNIFNFWVFSFFFRLLFFYFNKLIFLHLIFPSCFLPLGPFPFSLVTVNYFCFTF